MDRTIADEYSQPRIAGILTRAGWTFVKSRTRLWPFYWCKVGCPSMWDEDIDHVEETENGTYIVYKKEGKICLQPL